MMGFCDFPTLVQTLIKTPKQALRHLRLQVETHWSTSNTSQAVDVASERPTHRHLWGRAAIVDSSQYQSVEGVISNAAS